LRLRNTRHFAHTILLLCISRIVGSQLDVVAVLVQLVFEPLNGIVIGQVFLLCSLYVGYSCHQRINDSIAVGNRNQQAK
jgi:hypothetical protein